MSDKDIDKAINESVANVDIENKNYTYEELVEIKETIKNKESNHILLRKLINLHSKKVVGEELDDPQK